VPAIAAAAPQSRDCKLPKSNADALVILSNYYPGYWWDHTHLTVAVQAHPNADPAHVRAVRQAIRDWDYALRQEFGGLITLTDVMQRLLPDAA